MTIITTLRTAVPSILHLNKYMIRGIFFHQPLPYKQVISPCSILKLY
uniref:Uncharacterized protein n=1 Tax=Arundo donax TaxID=35708 RepID=A0A0A9EVQ9_ARUDO